MDRERLRGEVKELLVSGLRLDVRPADIVDGAPIFGDGLGLDSLDAPELVVLAEERFRLSFPAEAAAEACRAAGLGPDLGRDAAVYVGTTTGGMFETEEAYRRRRAGEDDRFRLSRLLGTPLATAGAVVSQALGLYGRRETFS